MSLANDPRHCLMCGCTAQQMNDRGLSDFLYLEDKWGPFCTENCGGEWLALDWPEQFAAIIDNVGRAHWLLQRQEQEGRYLPEIVTDDGCSVPEWTAQGPGSWGLSFRAKRTEGEGQQ